MKYRTTQKIKDTILETKLQECRLRPTKTVFKLDTSNPTMPSLDLKIHSLIVFCFFGAIKSPYVPASYLKHKYVCVCVCRCYNQEGYRPLACLSFFPFFFPTCLVKGERGLPLGIEDASLELCLTDVDASLELLSI